MDLPTRKVGKRPPRHIGFGCIGCALVTSMMAFFSYGYALLFWRPDIEFVYAEGSKTAALSFPLMFTSIAIVPAFLGVLLLLGISYWILRRPLLAIEHIVTFVILIPALPFVFIIGILLHFA